MLKILPIALVLMGIAGVGLIELAWHDMVGPLAQEQAIHLGSVVIGVAGLVLAVLAVRR